MLFPAGMAYGQNKMTGATPTSGSDSLSYALGVQVASFYKMQGVDSVNSSQIKKAFDDVYSGKNTLSPEEAGSLLQQKMQEIMMSKVNKVKAESERFLAENKKKEGVITLPSGLQYEILEKGEGAVPGPEDRVKAHYTGKLLNGKEFDNSYKRGEPLELSVGGVIKGWQEALQLMPVGSKWKLFIPSDLAYGDRGAGGGEIPGGSALIFTIELLEITE